jgi:putative phage-type endonuclease
LSAQLNIAPDVTKDRHIGLGASEALAYCGKDPRCSRLQLYLRKVGEAGENPGEDPRQQWGHRLEPVVRDWLAEELGVDIIPSPPRMTSSAYPFLFAHLDGDIPSLQAVAEIKTSDRFLAQDFGEVGTDDVPIRYVLQCHHQMIVTGYRRAHLAALIGGNDARRYVIDYDDQLATSLIARAHNFWTHVESRQPPEVVTLHDADKRWPISKDIETVCDVETVVALERLVNLRGQIKALETDAEVSELVVKKFMGNADCLTDATGTKLATWKSQTREALDSKALTAAHPEIAAQYRKVSQFRVFRIK